MVVILFIFGVSSVKEFAAPLMVGIVGGTFSSITITGALWYIMRTKIQKKNRKRQGRENEEVLLPLFSMRYMMKMVYYAEGCTVSGNCTEISHQPHSRKADPEPGDHG